MEWAHMTTKAYIEKLIRDVTDRAIVEAVGHARLSVRVGEPYVRFVQWKLNSEMPITWRCDVSALGYVEPFVSGVHIFA